MKPIWKIVLVATLLLSAANCVLLLRSSIQTTKQPQPLGSEGEYVVDVSYRVPYDYARTCIDNYAKRVASVNDSMVLSFTIDRQDFLQTIKIQSDCPIDSKYEYARGYIGLDAVTNEFHIFFTPVEGVKTDKKGNIVEAGRDVILFGKYQTTDRFTGRSIVSNNNGDDTGPYMLDLNAPCPETCSPLPTPGEALYKELKARYEKESKH
jgi:hypothetical protein